MVLHFFFLEMVEPSSHSLPNKKLKKKSRQGTQGLVTHWLWTTLRGHSLGFVIRCHVHEAAAQQLAP